jgi:hypothetical protein
MTKNATFNVWKRDFTTRVFFYYILRLHYTFECLVENPSVYPVFGLHRISGIRFSYGQDIRQNQYTVLPYNVQRFSKENFLTRQRSVL